MANTKEELENTHENVYYFKNLEENPLTTVDVGDTIGLENTMIEVQATGQVQINEESHGFLAGDTVE